MRWAPAPAGSAKLALNIERAIAEVTLQITYQRRSARPLQLERLVVAELDAYRRKRDFAATPEPADAPEARPEPAGSGRRFVVQRHAARRLHHDLRLEHDGVLLSWAVPKGPSLDPGQKRLAVQTEPHPLAYAEFEGVIPAGQYGAGPMIVWDRGEWTPEGDVAEALARGRLRFRLNGEKLRGRWNLVRTPAQPRAGEPGWLLIKSRDAFARRGAEAEITLTEPRSVLSHLRVEELPATGPTPAAVELPQVAPQLASLAPRPPSGPDWLHEIKLDGYRLIAYVRGRAIELRTRGGEDWTSRLPALARALAVPGLANCVLDGELCFVGEDGVSRFAGLQQALASGRTDDLVYSVFDLPVAHGRDLRAAPLRERKATLERILAAIELDPRVRFWAHVVGDGPEILARACALGAEGLVSKRADASYQGRRTTSWRKTKCPQRITARVVGFTAPAGSRPELGALVLARRDDAGRLRYLGKVGAGFDEATLATLGARLRGLVQAEPALSDAARVRIRGRVTWVAPELEVVVDYAELTDEGLLRQPRYVALRDPHAAPPTPASLVAARPHPVARPTPEPAAGEPERAASVRLTHPSKLVWPALGPDRGLSKRELADYMLRVSAWMLPHVRERPLSLVRCPDGVGGACFFQKQVMAGQPASIGQVTVRDRSGADLEYLCVRDALGLVGLVQMSAVELHPWGSRAGDLERPDRLVFDLDPDPALAFAEVVAAAVEIRDRLAELGLPSFVKTTGGKGLHVVVPIAPALRWGPSKRVCRALVERWVAANPRRYVAIARKAARRGKIFIDYLRNGRGATSVAAYSPRARAGAPVSTPLAWDELTGDLSPGRYTVRTIPERLAGLARDPWAALATPGDAAPSLIPAASALGVALDDPA